MSPIELRGVAKCIEVFPLDDITLDGVCIESPTPLLSTSGEWERVVGPTLCMVLLFFLRVTAS